MTSTTPADITEPGSRADMIAKAYAVVHAIESTAPPSPLNHAAEMASALAKDLRRYVPPSGELPKPKA